MGVVLVVGGIFVLLHVASGLGFEDVPMMLLAGGSCRWVR